MSRGSAFSEEQQQYIIDNCKNYNVTIVTENLNKTFGTSYSRDQVYYYAKKAGLPVSKYSKKRYRSIFPDEIKEFIKNNYYKTPNKDLLEMVNDKFGTNYTIDQLKAFRSYHQYGVGVKKGTKWSDIYEPDVREEMLKRYQPMRKEIGAERVTEGYGVMVKVKHDTGRYDNWRLKKYVVWEEANGPVPEGYTIVFVDGDTNNCSLDNLRCVPKGVGSMYTHHLRGKIATTKEQKELNEMYLVTTMLDKKLAKIHKGKKKGAKKK